MSKGLKRNLSIINSTFSGNTAEISGGSIHLAGFVTAVFERLLVANSSARRGGGIFFGQNKFVPEKMLPVYPTVNTSIQTSSSRSVGPTLEAEYEVCSLNSILSILREAIR